MMMQWMRHRAALQQVSRRSGANALRSFSAKTPETEKAPEAEEPLTNKKLWNEVLANHPEQNDRQNGDLLYEYPRKGYFGILSAGSLAHIAFWSWLKGYEESLAEMLPALGEPTTFSWLTNDLGSSIGFGSSIMLSFLVGFHARRAVARISVVAGGDKLRITTHKFFGDLGKPQDVPVAHVSANPNTKNNIILKIGKDRFFYLVDTKGNFYNRKKLESMITFRTDFTEHEKMMEKTKTYEIRTDLPRTELKPQTSEPLNIKAPKNLLGRKPSVVTRKHKSGKKK